MLIPGISTSEGIDDYILASKEQAEALKQNGIEADLIYLHKDWQKRDSAPVIQLRLLTSQTQLVTTNSFMILSPVKVKAINS